ncbi:MAG TPA: phage portal protein [Sideroxyarcus sp.]|nr:phage portal protein [Sideroxyarcus sp.]
MSLNSDELGLIRSLVKKLSGHARDNQTKELYYEGKQRLKDLNISVPPSLKLLNTVVGWAGTAVDVIEERLDFEGYINDQYGLADVYRQNELDLESSLGHKDALIYGTGFVFVGRGRPEFGEPEVLITIESPKRATVMWDMRARRVSAALLADFNEKGKVASGSLWLPDETIYFVAENDAFFEVSRDVHNLGRVTVSPLVNNPRSGDPYGRSEITRAVRYYTESAVRTLLGAEVAREFYSSPQRYVLGADESVFEDADGNPIDRWSVIQGRVLGLPFNEESGQMPQVGQFQANSPTPYFDQIRALAQMLAAETAIPPTYLGFQTDNPASADAIRTMEARLVKRAERRQKQFGRTWSDVGRMALLVRDGALPDGAADIRAVWRDASTPTRAAAADEVVKLIGAGVLPADSEIVQNRIGLSDSDKQVLKAERTTAQASSLIAGLVQATNPTGQ